MSDNYEFFLQQYSMFLNLEALGLHEAAAAFKDSLDPLWFDLTIEEQDRIRFGNWTTLKRFKTV